MKILPRQGYHLLALLILVFGVGLLLGDDALSGTFLGRSARDWLSLSLAVAVVHQVYVLICWRGELHYQALTGLLGRWAFPLYGAGFMILFLARPVLITGLALADQGSLPLAAWIRAPLALICLVLSGWLAASVVRFFGLRRALGEDHFRPDRYRQLPLVRQGIFRWTSNAMYLYGFLLLWVPGLLLESRAAILAALFSHLYIWVHYFTTEKPDLDLIYSS